MTLTAKDLTLFVYVGGGESDVRLADTRAARMRAGIGITTSYFCRSMTDVTTTTSRKTRPACGWRRREQTGLGWGLLVARRRELA